MIWEVGGALKRGQFLSDAEFSRSGSLNKGETSAVYKCSKTSLVVSVRSQLV